MPRKKETRGASKQGAQIEKEKRRVNSMRTGTGTTAPRLHEPMLPSNSTYQGCSVGMNMR